MRTECKERLRDDLGASSVMHEQLRSIEYALDVRELVIELRAIFMRQHKRTF